jgi:hypothetical protein
VVEPREVRDVVKESPVMEFNIEKKSNFFPPEKAPEPRPQTGPTKLQRQKPG